VYGYRPTTRLLSMLELLQAREDEQSIAREATGGRGADRTPLRGDAQGDGRACGGRAGRYGFYTLRPGFKLPPMMFTDEEALALALGLLSTRGLGLSGIAPAAEGTLAKLERVMPEGLRGRVQTFEE
jgi:predicted DNA-binding transcriptional regulator YafY